MHKLTGTSEKRSNSVLYKLSINALSFTIFSLRLPCLSVSDWLSLSLSFKALTEPSFPDGFVLSFPMRTNYMYGLVRKEITEMYAFTACVWLKAKEGGIGTPFSYSVPGQPNELVLLQGVHNPVELLINDKVDGDDFLILFSYLWV